MIEINNHADNSTYTLLYQRLVGAKVIFGRRFMRHKQWEMNHVANYLLENVDNGMVLDIGCSTGYLTNHLSKKFGPGLVAGADISLSSIQRNRSLYKKIDFYHIDKNFYKEHKTRYAAITLMHVLEHIEEPVPFLQKIIKLLDKNGILVVSVPQERIRGDLAFFENIYNLFRGKFKNVHLRNYTYNTLSDELNEAGLNIQYHKYNNMLSRNSNKRRLTNHSLIVYTKENSEQGHVN